jgi:aminopeptidase-like protein
MPTEPEIRTRKQVAETDLSTRLEDYFDRLWPISRSITGPGFRESLGILAEVLPTERLRFETGRQVFDWTVPPEWRVREAYFVDPKGHRHADFRESNLHLVGYSRPFRGRLTLDHLRPHLHSLPELPEAVPFVTSYYRDYWGFCLPHGELLALPEGEYEVCVDTELAPGHLEVGEAILPGAGPEEILFSTYLCHPSLANNELSGPLAMAFLYERLAQRPRRRLTYRFAITAETIGTLCYLSERGEYLRRSLVAGYVMTCLASESSPVYKLSRRGDSLGDRAARIVLRDHGPHTVIPFDPGDGSDERQYCSPGFDLPVGSLMRTMYGGYPEYHTSLDNKDAISFAALAGSIDLYERIVDALESNVAWRNTVQFGEPQLGRHGLYPSLSTGAIPPGGPAFFWVLNLADGEHDMLAVAERSRLPLAELVDAAERLEAVGLLERG